jgi:hypothetical protein
MQDMLRFLYIALREYWITWVTGTGLAGFTLWAVNFYADRVRKKPMSLRTNLMVLFCFFWFVATFSAWHDADKNLQAEIKLRQQNNSNFGECRGDLKTEQAKVSFLDQQNKAQQSNLVAIQQNVNTQITTLATSQTAISGLVTQLGKINELQPQTVVVKMAPFQTLSSEVDSVMQFVWVIAAVPNKPITPVHGIISCERGFTGLPSAKLVGGGSMTDVQMGALNSKQVIVKFSSPVWTPDSPIIVAGLVSSNIGPGKCKFEDQP